MIPSFKQFNEQREVSKFPHRVYPESYWRKILETNKFALSVLDTVFKKQNGFASDRQMALLNRAKAGDRSSYSTKN